MYHVFDEEWKLSYVFVYDDKDGSVEYAEMSNLLKLGGQFGDSLPFFTSYFPFAKLQMMGWALSGDVLSYDFCEYSIGGIHIGMQLIVNRQNGYFQTLFIFSEERGRDMYNFHVEFCKSAWNYILMDNNTTDTCVIRLKCPTIMISWLMNLKAKNNFKGVMQAFNNLFGSDIAKLVSNISFRDVNFEEWY